MISEKFQNVVLFHCKTVCNNDTISNQDEQDIQDSISHENTRNITKDKDKK